MTQLKTYTIPQDLADISLEAAAYANAGNAYVKMPFGYKKAAKSFKSYQKLNCKFWQKVFKLYPELEGKNLSVNTHTLCVFENVVR